MSEEICESSKIAVANLINKMIGEINDIKSEMSDEDNQQMLISAEGEVGVVTTENTLWKCEINLTNLNIVVGGPNE